MGIATESILATYKYQVVSQQVLAKIPKLSFGTKLEVNRKLIENNNLKFQHNF